MWSLEAMVAVRRHRAGEKDREDQGRGHQDLKEVRELPRWYPAPELPGEGQVRWLAYNCSLPQIAQIQVCPIHMRHWHSDTKGRADLGHEFATAGFCFFK